MIRGSKEDILKYFDFIGGIDDEYKIVEHGLLQPKKSKKYFDSINKYLKKFYSAFNFQSPFIKTFFSVDRLGALNYVSSIDPSSVPVYFNDSSFLVLSNELVYKNYITFIETISDDEWFSKWGKVYVYKEDELCTNDSFLFVNDGCCVLIKNSLVDEKLSFYRGYIFDGCFYFLFFYHISLQEEDFDSLFLLDDFLPDVLLSEAPAVKDDLGISTFPDGSYLTFSELLDFLEFAKIIKMSRKGLRVLNEDVFYSPYFNFFHSNSLVDFVNYSSSVQRLKTISPVKVKDVLSVVSFLLLNDKNFSIDDIYWFYIKVFKKDFYTFY